MISQRNKGYLFVELFVAMGVSLALFLASVSYVERIVFYRMRSSKMEEALSLCVQSLDNILAHNGKNISNKNSFFIKRLERIKGPLREVGCSVLWYEGEHERIITLWSVPLEKR